MRLVLLEYTFETDLDAACIAASACQRHISRRLGRGQHLAPQGLDGLEDGFLAVPPAAPQAKKRIGNYFGDAPSGDRTRTSVG